MKISDSFRPAARALCALAVVAAFAACGDDNGGTGPNAGSITVSVTTTGVGIDSDGYVVIVDNGDGVDVAPNGDVSISTVAGSHSVELSNVGSNCTVSGDNPRTVEVAAGEDVTVTFQVTCVARTIAFVSNRSGSFNIYTMRVDGSGLDQLTDDAGPGFSNFPDWSPDGSKIVFSSTRDRSTTGLDIWVMGADGANPTRLTEAAGQNGRAEWSHDGTKIVFTSTRDAAGAVGVAEIWVMDADGSNQRALTSDGKFANTPSWSADDSKIVFQSNRDGTDQLYVMNADGSGITRLTNGAWGDQEPAWSPDGAFIAFQSTRDATAPVDNSDFEVYVMNADGSSPTRLTSNTALDGRASWSPDGSQLIFDSRRDGNEEVYLMNRDGSGQVNITNNAAEDGFARFRP
jgi:Tol biopolymer transport system component